MANDQVTKSPPAVGTASARSGPVVPPLSISDKTLAALSYLSVLFLVPLIWRRQQPEVCFNAKQGMVLFGAELLVWLALWFVEALLLVFLPSVRLPLVIVLAVLAWAGFVIVSLMGIYFVFNDRHWEIPLIGKIAKRIRF